MLVPRQQSLMGWLQSESAQFQVGHTSAGEKSPPGGAKQSHLSLKITCGLRIH